MGYSSKSSLHLGLNCYTAQEFKQAFESKDGEQRTVRFWQIIRNVAPVAAHSRMDSKALDYWS